VPEIIGQAQVVEHPAPSDETRHNFTVEMSRRPEGLRLCMLFNMAQQTEDPTLHAHIWRVAAVMLGGRHDLAARTRYEMQEPNSPSLVNREITRNFQIRWMIAIVGRAYGVSDADIAKICQCHHAYEMWVLYDPTGESFSPDVRAAEQDAYAIIGASQPTAEARLRVALD
jgi:hypothetical protein